MPHLSVTIFRHSFYDFAMPTLEIVVLTYRRAPLLRRCLASLDQASRAAGTRSRVVVVVNGEDSSSVDEIASAERDFSSLEIESIQSHERLPCGFARNTGVERARADWIYFADDDAWVAPDFLSTFYSFVAENPDVAVVGGPNLTSSEMSPFQKIAGAVLGSPLAAGPFSRRYRGGGKIASVENDHGLILCNLFVRRSALADYRFPEALSCAEENHMLHFLDVGLTSEGKVFHPGLAVLHERAVDASRFAASAVRYGRGRGELISLDGLSVRSSRLVMASFALVLLLLAALPLMWIYFYGALIGANAVWIATKLRSPRALLLAPMLTLVLHLLYPLGVLIGICQTPVQSLKAMSAPILALAESKSNRRPRSRD